VADLIHSERDVLQRYLTKNRQAVISACGSLTEQQLRSAGVPSGTSLLGLVAHLTGAEQHWFRFVFLGENIRCNLSMDVPAAQSAVSVIAAYRQACRESDAVIANCPDLSTLAAVANPGEQQLDSLRLITAHMVEETARHAGHADILREMIDGATEL
jgi:uncharacterized damage-inducible protein DinB